MFNIAKRLLTFALLWAFPLGADNVQAQGDEVTSVTTPLALNRVELWNEIESVYQRLEKILRYTDKPATRYPTAAEQNGCSLTASELMHAQVLETEAKETDHNRGFSFNGYYAQSEIDDGADSTGRAYLELSWDILEAGYFGNKADANSLYQQSQLSTLKAELQQINLNYLCHQYLNDKLFVAAKTALYQLKVDLLTPVYTIERRAYFKGWSHFDDFLVAEEGLLSSQDKLQQLALLSAAKPSELSIPPIYDIDIHSIRRALDASDNERKIASIKKQIIEDKADANSTNKLRLFVRNEFSSGSSDNGIVAGLRFSIPLQAGTEDSTTYKKLEIDESSQLKSQLRRIKLDNGFTRYQLQRDRAIKQQYRVIRSYERARRSLVEKRLTGDTELGDAVIRLRTLLNASIELVTVRQELYQRIMSVLAASGLEFDQRYIKTAQLKTSLYRGRTGSRFIYMWSSAFNATNNLQIVDVAKAKNLERILISAGKKTNLKKYLNFIKIAKQQSIQVESIVGANNWIFPTAHDRAATTVGTTATYTGKVHLDIEPHTLPNFKSNKPQYLAHYVAMLTRIRSNNQGVILTVALPNNWPPTVYKEINSLVDGIYIMAYGSSSVSKIGRKLQPILDVVDAEKLAVVLRVSDFEDEWELEQTFEEIVQKLGIRSLGIHQYKTFIRKASENI